jgi:hypothetical protein
MNTTLRTAESFKGTGRYEVDVQGINIGWVTKTENGWNATYRDEFNRPTKAGCYATRKAAVQEVWIYGTH